MRWLPDRSVESLAGAIRTVAPELAAEPITLPGRIMQSDPVWHASTARIGDAYVAKFAWSEPAAKRIAHEIDVLRALAGWAYVPDVVAAATDPLLLVTRRVEGSSLFRVIDSIDRDRAGVQLAQFLAALHEPTTLRRIESAPKACDGPGYPLAATVLSERIGPFIRPGHRATVVRWCDWADAVLAEPRPDVLVHGDLHGDNELWRRDRLLLVVDWETAGRAEAAYDLRAVLGTGPGVELLVATTRHYERLSGRQLEVERVLAWHLRSALHDAVWRSEAGIPLPDRRTPPEWIDDLAARFEALGF